MTHRGPLALRDWGRSGAQLRSCPPPCGLLLNLTALNATASPVRQHGWYAQVFTGIHAATTNTAGCRRPWGGWCSEVKEEDRAQPGPGDMSGAIYPRVFGPHNPAPAIAIFLVAACACSTRAKAIFRLHLPGKSEVAVVCIQSHLPNNICRIIYKYVMDSTNYIPAHRKHHGAYAGVAGA